ncbi:type I restriction endonuclease [Asticcacaulis sp.]|uniref:type I restriction endonuclease n=1 Tax=Asticcacaulis sp. TaxID=1872648 RepID=UPI003F7B9747
MEFSDKLNNLSAKIRQQMLVIKTEEATKTAFVLPFINTVLGYDVFDPSEVVPEFICDIGTKKGEKIDYAVMKDGNVQMLFECKKIGEALNLNHASQLFRYFHVTNARIGILTNGQRYKFFTDLDNKNKMDEKPFLELDLLEIDDNIISELSKLTKDAFDIDSIVNAAGELKYIGQIKKIIANQFSNPDEDLVKFFTQRVYDGINTQKIRDQFSILTKKAMAQFLNDQINDRLKTALSGNTVHIPSTINYSSVAPTAEIENDGIVTTEEEMEGYHIVKAISRSVVDGKRIFSRDAKSYFAILLDDNNRKPIVRLHFNSKKKQISLFDGEKNEVKYEIAELDDIYQYADQILTTLRSY